MIDKEYFLVGTIGFIGKEPNAFVFIGFGTILLVSAEHDKVGLILCIDHIYLKVGLVLMVDRENLLAESIGQDSSVINKVVKYLIISIRAW